MQTTENYRDTAPGGKEKLDSVGNPTNRGLSHSHHSHIVTKQCDSAFRVMARTVTMTNTDMA